MLRGSHFQEQARIIPHRQILSSVTSVSLNARRGTPWFVFVLTKHVALRVYLGVKTCEVFLCLVAIVRVRVYYVDFFVFFLLRHW